MMDRTREFIPVPGSLLFRVSSLHFLLRVFEFFLNVGSNQTFKQWQCTAPFKDQQKANKAKMKAEARTSLGLILFDPRPGGAGNFHDGNSARRAFEKPEIFAQIVGVGVELIKKTYNIYLAMVSGLEIDSAKFKVLQTKSVKTRLKITSVRNRVHISICTQGSKSQCLDNCGKSLN
jgi:hypothetical protein